MNFRRATVPISLLQACLLLVVGTSVHAQEAASADTTPATVRVTAGQSLTVSGVIVARGADDFTLRDFKGSFYEVTLNTATRIKERKTNPFRGAKNYNPTEILRGLEVEVKGRGASSGAIQAETVSLRNDDLHMAQSLWAGINPVEQELKQAETRLAQAELNEKRMSGQLAELQATSNTIRDSAKSAQDTADAASKAASEAAKSADTANVGVRTTNDRVTSLDDFDVKDDVVVNFAAGSAVLSKEAKEQLDKLAESTKGEKGFVIEVAGFASSDGNKALNQRLSQRRADTVIQYLAENYDIPLRRFVTPVGYGDMRPAASNQTHEGRAQNRRVEVRNLVNKGLTHAASVTNQ